MIFRLRKILSEVKELYSKPASPDRFKAYITKLQGGTKGDLALPITGFNPMAKDHILTKIEALEKLAAEDIMQESINKFNAILKDSNDDEITVLLNIADDLKGGWTNYYTTDFDSKFKINAFVKRQFCVPYFWSSESYSQEKIETRTLDYLSRTLYRINNPQPVSLEEHLNQEIFVAQLGNSQAMTYNQADYVEAESYYLEHKHSEKYDRIFNFFYGDEGSISVGYKSFGSRPILGFDYSKIVAEKRKNNT